MISCKVYVLGASRSEAIRILSASSLIVDQSIPTSKSRIGLIKRFENLLGLLSREDLSQFRTVIRFIQFSYNNFSTVKRMFSYQYEMNLFSDSWESKEPVLLDHQIWSPRSAFRFGLLSRDMSEHHEYDLYRKPEFFKMFLIPITSKFIFANHRRITDFRKILPLEEDKNLIINDAEIAHGVFVLKNSKLLNLRIDSLDNVKSIYFENISNQDAMLTIGVSHSHTLDRAIFAGSNSNWWHFISEICVSLVMSETSMEHGQPLILQDHLPSQAIDLARTITGVQPFLVNSFSHLNVMELKLLPTVGGEFPLSSEDWRHGMRVIRERVLTQYGTPNTSDFKKIFVPRSVSTFRRLLNRKEIAKFLVGEGFLIIHPEDLSLAHQVDVFSNSNVIVIESGAAMANLLFAPFEAKVVELQPSVGELTFWRDVTKMMNFNYRVVKGTSRIFSRQGIASDSYVINIDSLRSAVIG